MSPADRDNVSSTSERSGGSKDNDQNPASASTQDQILLKALQEFFVPLVRSVVDPRGANASYHTPLGPEATELISALKKFISSVMESSTTSEQNTVNIDLDVHEGSIISLDRFKSRDYLNIYRNPNMPEALDRFKSMREANTDRNSNVLDLPEQTFRNKLLRALREHVFNKMPIRLLCIKPQGSSLEISLIERPSIYQYIEATIMQANGHDPEYGWERLGYLPDGSPIFETDEQAINRLLSKYAGYAILSHNWLRAGEITYREWTTGRLSTKALGYQKLINFCKIAIKDHGLTLAWIDTLCINKDSSTELDESIRSMYVWYERATVCFVYLAGTRSLSEFHLDPWFTRGWTLQELIAPRVLKFYNRGWLKLEENSDNDRYSNVIVGHIYQATTISWDELHFNSLTSLSRRMQLAASREVTREEDMAYSLMGIFNVSIATAYGEGASRAFYRLLQEVLSSTPEGALELFNWAGDLPRSALPTTRLLPPSPHFYSRRSNGISLKDLRPLEPLTLTHLGLHIPVVLMPGVAVEDSRYRYNTIGDYTAIADVYLNSYDKKATSYHLLDPRVFGYSDGPPIKTQRIGQHTFAVFNIEKDPNGIFIPVQCTAILLECGEDAGKVTSAGKIDKVDTWNPIVFYMESKRPYIRRHDINGVVLPLDELAEHGMQFISLYL